MLDPVDRHLGDARQVAGDKELPDPVKARVVPTLCRQALEATCVEIVRRRRLSRGDRHEEVEKVIAAANKLNKSFALAMFDAIDEGGAVLPKLNEWGWQMAQTYQACNKGAHGAHVGDPKLLVSDTRALVNKLRTADMTPPQLLGAARKLLDHPVVSTGWRPVAVAALARQALEAAIDDFWARAAPGAEAAARQTQLLCLSSYTDEGISELAAITWVLLSGACHVRAYDLTPSHDELSRWLSDTDAVLAGLAATA